MFRPGLVSVTFRKLSPSAIVQLAVQAKLQGIEWGGDIHVPHGDIAAARGVRRLTEEAGLSIAAYGSYYRAADLESPAFETVLETAVVLGAPTIRVWAGRRPSADSDAAHRAAVAADLHRVAAAAGAANITISLEFHGGTLTDTAASTLDLLAQAAHPNLFTYWQPAEERSAADCLADIHTLLPRITNIHVFQWTGPAGSTVWHPLSEGLACWQEYLKAFPAIPPRWALLEFVRGHDPGQFLADAATLHDLLVSK